MRTWVVPALFGLFVAAVTIGLAGCTHQSPSPASMKDVVLLTREGCANTVVLRANLDAALTAMDKPKDYLVLDLAKVADSDPRNGYPTPTLLYRGTDIFGTREPLRSPHPEPT